jgi:SAM-dependent methyltransferase
MFCEICGSREIVRSTEGKFGFITCATCKVKYHNPLPSKEFLAKWYSKNALAKRWKGDITYAVRTNYKENRANYPNYLELIRDVPITGLALDMGCYAGYFLTHLIKRGFKGIGIDLNGGLVEHGKKEFGIDLRQGDILDIGFASSTFDLITCHQVFEHLRNPHTVLEEINRILKPNGFAISVPDASCNKKVSYPEHLFHFTASSLEHLFSRLSLSCTITSNDKQKALFILGRKPNEGV